MPTSINASEAKELKELYTGLMTLVWNAANRATIVGPSRTLDGTELDRFLDMAGQVENSMQRIRRILDR